MRSIRRISTLAWLPVFLSVVTPATSAAQADQAADTTTESVARLADPMVIVANHNWLDVHVYARRSTGARVSLGVVTSNTTRKFDLPAGFLSTGQDVYLIADPIGSTRHYVTPAIFADPGTNVIVHVENALNQSSASLRAAKGSP